MYGQTSPDLSAAQSSPTNLPDFLQTSPDKEEQIQELTDEAFGEMTEEQKRQVPGVMEYELALRFEQDGSYDEAELALKEALKHVKKEGQDMAKTYLYLMQKLAHISFLN